LSNRLNKNKAQAKTQKGQNPNNYVRFGDFNNTSVTDLRNVEGEPGQSIQVDETGNALEFVDVPAKTKCFTIAMSIVLG
jgi:hypothetical protein